MLTRKMFRWVAPTILCVAVATPALADGNANFNLGRRALDKDFWEPVEEHGVFGVTVDFGAEDWPINLEAGSQLSGAQEEEFDFFLASDVEVTAAIVEFNFGVNKTWKPKGGIRPYIGGGLASVGAAGEVDAGFFGDADDDDQSFGAYVHGGVFWRLGPRFNIGFDARALLGTEITLFGVEGDADYLQFGMLLGFGWPGSK